MNTPETMIMAGTAIKILIDVFGFIPSYMKRPVALLLWLAWAFAFLDMPIDTTLFFGLTTWASAIGINELATKKKVLPNDLPDELWSIITD